jgi:PAS domain S-box-containing protein
VSRVLVVDDNADNRYYLESLLSGHGDEVEVAGNGEEALAAARATRPDVVVSDLLMPVMDGYTLLRHWRADPELRDVPFLVYTATYTEAADERLALDLGADAFVLKPAEPETFVAALREVQARQEVAAPTEPYLPEDGGGLLRSYSETLIRKLERKTLQLEETNQALHDDIEARERVAAELRERDEQVRLLTDSIPHIVWITDAAGYHLEFNQRWYDYTGLTPEESVGDGWNPAFHPDDRAASSARWREATESGEPYEIEYRLRRADGEYHWMLGRALPLRDRSGTIVRWFGTCTDIDELKRAEGRIREQARLLDLTQDAISVHDLDQRIVYWNEGAHRLHGWAPEEAVGRRVGDLHCPDVAQLDAVMDALLRDGEWSGELRLVDRAGEDLVVEGRWTLLCDDDGQPRSVLSVDTDVTARRRIEAQFLRTQRLQSIGTLAGGIAHDLNNMLSPILAGAELLRLREDDERSLELIDTVLASAQRGADLVRQVLSFARGVDGARVNARLERTIEEVVAIARTTFPKDIEVVTEVPDDLWGVIGDPTQLHQVLMNLCVNARDAMAGGGRLLIAARNEELRDGLVGVVPVLQPGRYVVLEVEDDGCGMSQELLERVFEPFVTTKEVGRGSGLGLSTVLGIVTSHAGALQVESEEGRGSRFSVHLPAQRGTGTAEPTIDEVTDAPAGEGRMVLVVDDEEAILATTRRMLTASGYRVLTANDGARALELYAEHRGEIAVVLTDVTMPVMDGAALVAALRRVDPEVRVVATSGVLASGADRSRDLGVRHLLPKPYSGAQLRSVLAAALDDPGGADGDERVRTS